MTATHDGPIESGPAQDHRPAPSHDAQATISIASPSTATAQAHQPPPATARIKPETIGGYRILDLLGEGAMGIVWEAEQKQPRRRVALKVMRQGHLVDELHAQIFHREAETLGRLRHPNIAAIYESGHTTDGHDFFAM